MVPISPWHDVPFTLGDDEHGVPLLSFVCEIPRHTRAKVEIHKSIAHNPLLQDVHKNGTLREYVYSPAIINYGAIAQTWEDPEIPDDDTALGGDNDPIDVLQLNEGACERGAVQRVRVLGGLAVGHSPSAPSRHPPGFACRAGRASPVAHAAPRRRSSSMAARPTGSCS